MYRLPLLTAGLALVLLAACATPVPTRQYVVFFEGEETSLTPVADQVVDEVIHTERELHPAHVIVEGEADGSSRHAADLALGRAARVAAALEGAGIAPQKIIQRQAPPGPGGEGVEARKVTISFEK